MKSFLRPSFHQVHSDEACLSENLASAKWCRDAGGLEAKGQPEDRWQANHVENESLEGKCRGVDGGWWGVSTSCSQVLARLGTSPTLWSSILSASEPPFHPTSPQLYFPCSVSHTTSWRPTCCSTSRFLSSLSHYTEIKRMDGILTNLFGQCTNTVFSLCSLCKTNQQVITQSPHSTMTDWSALMLDPHNAANCYWTVG